MFDRYQRVIEVVRGTPWAIRREKLAIIKDLLTLRAAGLTLTPQEIRMRLEAAAAADGPERAQIRAARLEADCDGATRTAAVAVLPLVGIIAQRLALMDEISGPGSASTERFAAMFRQAVADRAVDAIVADIDSPGGAAYGVPELADEILAARGRKPLIAVANAEAMSAAYWIASAFDELVVTPSAAVGSIGVYMIHENIAEALKAEGIAISLVSAGKYKVDGNPFEPLTDTARADMQEKVDGYYDLFVKGVARGRGVTQTKVREEFGEGRAVLAKDAVRLGMADRIGTLQETLERLAGKAAGSRSASAAVAGEGVQTSAPGAADQTAAGDEDLEHRRRRLRLQRLA